METENRKQATQRNNITQVALICFHCITFRNPIVVLLMRKKKTATHATHTLVAPPSNFAKLGTSLTLWRYAANQRRAIRRDALQQNEAKNHSFRSSVRFVSSNFKSKFHRVQLLEREEGVRCGTRNEAAKQWTILVQNFSVTWRWSFGLVLQRRRCGSSSATNASHCTRVSRARTAALLRSSPPQSRPCKAAPRAHKIRGRVANYSKD